MAVIKKPYRRKGSILNLTPPPRGPGSGTPTGHGIRTATDRQRIGSYIDAMLPKQLWEAGEDRDRRIEQNLNDISHVDRIRLEIEMTLRSRKTHSFDYDPL